MRKRVLQFGLGIGLIVGVFQSQAQTMLDNVFVEKYHIATVADNAADPNLAVGAITYRIYINMKPGFLLQSVYGNSTHALTIQTSTSFYNSPGGSNYANNMNKPTGVDLYDSWISLGTDSKGKQAVPLTENSAGQVAGTIASITTTSNTLDSSITASFDTQPGSNIFSITGDAYAKAGGVAGSAGTNSVLIGQFTTDGAFSYALNFQLGNTTGKAEVYVSSDPTTLTDGRFGEYTDPSLKGIISPNVLPTVSITAAATAIAGDIVTLTATANDTQGANGAAGSIKYVTFYDGTTLLGKKSVSPYTFDWTSTAGTHSITAIATDGDIDSTTSTPVSVVVAAATLSAPATASIDKAGTSTSIVVTSNISWTASTTDAWLTITPTTETTAGDNKLYISATANTADARIGTITLSSTRSTSKTITVTQASGLTLPTITLSATSATIGETANSTTTFDITSNAAWTVTSSEVWLTFNPATGTNGGTVTLTASANTGATRTATVTITSGSVTKTITITQTGITAIKEVQNQAIAIYPNPCKSSFVINSDNNAIVTIYSFIGEKLQTINASAHEKIAIDMLPSGIYFVSILINNIEYTQKLLKE
jgi:hypothetical protein